jgi:hypothetical protein
MEDLEAEAKLSSQADSKGKKAPPKDVKAGGKKGCFFFFLHCLFYYFIF